MKTLYQISNFKYQISSIAKLFIVLFVSACGHDKQFKLLTPDDTNIAFANALTIEDSLNILDNEFVYNGGGVAIADWNGDDLPDVFFTANMVDNALYLNRGKLKFEDITKKAGVNKPYKCWSAGATVVDINADGKQDLYVSNMMYGKADMRRNFLYVNQGNNAQGVPKFKEMAKEYGLAPDAYSAQTTFFDYDNDGDLDAYIVVNFMDMQFANQYLSPLARANPPTADKLLRNDFDATLGHAVFTDVSKTAGIEAQGYGHGVSVADFNQDGWLDLYVTNDYLSNDNLFINNQKGAFIDTAPKSLKHQSWSAMGNDVSDFNNDGLLDLVAMDMMPDFNERKKAIIRANSYNHNTFTEKYEYSYQYVRNTLQLGRGNHPQTGEPLFSEIGLLAGISETDWSWCPLWIDADNDGHRDLFISNGFPKDITDQDFLAYRKDIQSAALSKGDLYKLIPEVKIANYFFKNNGNLTFENKAQDWGLEQKTFSNGAAYADLDNDGDLDLVVNNINDYAYVYENTLQGNAENANNYLRIKLQGTPQNLHGIGAKVTVFANEQQWFTEQNIVRGYLSTSEPVLHFGLGKTSTLDSVRVVWPDQSVQTISKPTLNQLHIIKYVAGFPKFQKPKTTSPLLTEKTFGIDYQHIEADYVDFNVQKTLPHKYSQLGPSVTVGDINGDKLDDFYVGGSSRTAGTFFVQQPNGTFKQSSPRLKTDPQQREEDTGTLLFDADTDGDLDLYCVRGGYQHERGSRLYQDAIFLNDGRGNFTLDSLALPRETACGQTVRAADYDRDGDLDLFVGGRVNPQMYPTPERSFILRNDSPARRFTDVTAQIAPELSTFGMVADAIWTDFDNDKWPDLLLAAEWKAPTFFRNNKGKMTLETGNWKLENGTWKVDFSQNSPIGGQGGLGWWNSLAAADFDNDGDPDYVLGNYGLNIAHKATQNEPLEIYANDFDTNGSYDAFIAHYDNNANGERKAFVYHSRDDMIKQSLLFRKRFLKYADFGLATFDKILTNSDLEGVLSLRANELQSCFLENLGNGQFKMTPLPIEAQFAPIFGLLPHDLDQDGKLDLLLVGNDYGMELLQGRADAFYGLVLKNTGQKGFKAMSLAASGFVVPHDAKALTRLQVQGKNVFLATQNKGPLKMFELNTKQK